MSSPLERSDLSFPGLFSPDSENGVVTPKGKLNLSDQFSPDPSLASVDSACLSSERMDQRRPLSRPRSLHLPGPGSENMELETRNCTSCSPRSNGQQRTPTVPSKLNKSSRASPLSSYTSPGSCDGTSLKQIESPLGHMNLSPSAPFPSIFDSAQTLSEGSNDGFSTETLEAGMCTFGGSRYSTTITQLISAPLSSADSTSGGKSNRRDHFTSAKRCIPFSPASNSKRVPPQPDDFPTPRPTPSLPPVPTLHTSSSWSSRLPTVEEKSSVEGDIADSEIKAGFGFARSRSLSASLMKSPPLVSQTQTDDEEHLIGDNTKACSLPVLKGTHHKCISADTMCDLMDGKYSDTVGEYVVIDARYPYEFDGGHIKDATNIWSLEMLEKRFFDNPQHLAPAEKRSIVIFHCEFSSKRGPGMIQHLRNVDRTKNGVANFPKLYYPEVYLLQGGYSVFYHKAKEYCSPCSYREMHDVNFQEELKTFTRRSKSWTGPAYTSKKRTCRLFSNPHP